MMTTQSLAAVASGLLLTLGVGCGGGVPISVRIDEAAIEIDLDATMGELEQQLQAQGVLFPGVGIPEVWPDSLPDLQYSTVLGAPPVKLDLTPDDPNSKEAKKYKDVNKYSSAIRRIEVNRLIMRYEVNTTTLDFPSFEIRVADRADADPEDRFAWYTVGTVPEVEAGFVGDVEFEWRPGGESFFNAQFEDDDKELALRALGNLHYDTDASPNRPHGKAKIRLIAVVTFFIEPDTLYGTLQEEKSSD